MNDEAQLYGVEFLFQMGAPDNVPVSRMREAIEWVLIADGATHGSALTIVVTSDEEVQRLNREFRDVDAPTDVLSFPAEPEIAPETALEPEIYLGDLVLALPYIERQSLREGHSTNDELLLAVVHGTLHLLGYDHDSIENQAVMWAKQSAALAAMGVPITVPEFSFDEDDE